MIGVPSGPRVWTGTAAVRNAKLWTLLLFVVHLAMAYGLAIGVPPLYARWALLGYACVAVAGWMPLEARLRRRPLTIRQDGLALRLGRFGSARTDQRVSRGLWVDRYSGVELGAVLHLRTDGGRLVRIGGRGAQVPGHLCTEAATDSVEITLDAGALEALLAALRIEPVAARDGGATEDAGVRVSLFDRPDKGRTGCLRMVLPLLVLDLIALGGGGIVFLVSRANRDPHAQLAAGWVMAGTMAVILMFTIVRTRRRRPHPALYLDIDRHGCKLRDRKERVVATGTPTWRRLRYPFGDLRGRGRSCPVIELTLPQHKPIRLGILDPDLAWHDGAPETSSPRYLVGPVDWMPLLDALHRLDPAHPRDV